MNDHDILLRAILANPEDDAPRLAYADWLDENGGEIRCPKCKGLRFGFCSRCSGEGCSIYGIAANGPCGVEKQCDECNGTGRVSNGFAERAEFIRVQCELDKLPTECDRTFCDGQLVVCPDCRKRKQLWKIERNWIENNRRKFRDDSGIPLADMGLLRQEPLECAGPLFRFRKGLVEEVRCTLAQYLTHCHEIAAKHPVTKWILTDKEPTNDPLGEHHRNPEYHWFIFVPDPHYPSTNALPYEWQKPWERWEISMIKGGNGAYFTSKEHAMKGLQKFCYLYARRSLTLGPTRPAQRLLKGDKELT